MPNIKSPVIYILASLPLILWATLAVYPSYDDWSTLSSPNFDTDWTKFFLPYGSVWRPFDALMGYVTGMFPTLFPSLNHICIVAGHTASAFILYAITRRLQMGTAARFVAVIFFWLSPCTLGTTLSCDSLNQTYSHMWGMMAVWCCLSCKGARKYILWCLCVLMAALSKDNGIAWAVIPPIIEYSFDRCRQSQFVRGFAFGIVIAALYGCVRLSLPKTELFNPDYSTFLLSKKIKEIAMYVAYTWVAADYVSIVHAPSRCLPAALITLVLALPLPYMLFFKDTTQWFTRRFLGLTASILIVMSPHLLITLSVMNAYAGLGMAALLAGCLTENIYKRHPRCMKTAFALYIAAAVITDIHHCYKAVTTSVVGREMARTVIRLTGKPVNSAYCVVVDDDEKKFSSFCVLPQDAFGAQAGAVAHENQYKWPQHVTDTIIPRHEKARATAIAREALATGVYECAWIVDKKNISIIRRQ